MFLERPSASDQPTIAPLRINKSPEPVASKRPTVVKSDSYSLPPGASSSPAPLPYPDDRTRYPSSDRLPYPDHADSFEQVHAPRPYISTSSPQSASSSSIRPGVPEYPSALRARDGRNGSPVQPSTIAERRGAVPKPLPDSPGPETPDKEGLFQRLPQRSAQPTPQAVPKAQSPPKPAASTFDYNKHYYPPPADSYTSGAGELNVPNPGSVNRLASTASTSTTRAQRGSPPPPETPIVPPDDQPGGGIEARYAAAGIAGTSTLTSLQAQNAAAAQRANQYALQPPRGPSAGPLPQQEPPPRPWTPTELPGSIPHGPPTVYQGPGQASTSPPVNTSLGAGRQTSPIPQPGRAPVTTALEQDFQRIHVSASPPPAYSSVTQARPSGPTTAQGYPNEKHAQTSGPTSGAQPVAAAPVAAVGVAAGAAVAATIPESSRSQSHPAFANDPGQRQGSASSQPGHINSLGISHQQPDPAVPSGPGPASPPPLPEGWIAHLDPNSGQYYYIHLPTQSTQWEFPKGPTPLNLNEPLSPSGSVFSNPLQSPGLSTFGSKPLASPGFQPSTPGYAESVMSMQSATPTVTGFTGPPPSSGVDVYKVAPTNGVYFGPYLRYTNMDLERGVWLGSILLVTDAPQPPTIHIHQTIDLSPNPRQLKANPISKHQRWTFYRYDIDLTMEDTGSAKWTYAITSHLGCTRYEFLVAGRHETNWRFIATSGNDFSLNVSANERTRLGGIGFMWKDIMAKHIECGGFHTQLGLGDQIYGDRIWREIPLLKQWLATSGKENRKNEPWTARHEDDVTHAYFHFYTSHFDQPYLREAFAQIPHVLQIDDHDM